MFKMSDRTTLRMESGGLYSTVFLDSTTPLETLKYYRQGFGVLIWCLKGCRSSKIHSAIVETHVSAYLVPELGS
jgi:hypothetical protein